MSDDDFDWGDADIVIQVQMPVAVYTNPKGNIVIRPEGDYYRKEDAWVVLTPENARVLVAAILALAGPELEPEPPPRLALPAPADRTAAEQQRRYRNAKRSGSTVTPIVTRRDAPERFEVRPPD